MARHFSPSVKRAVVLTFHAVCLGVRGRSLLILVLLLGATMHQRNHPLLSLKSYQTASLSAAELWKKKHPLLWFELGLVALIITMAPHLLGLFGIVHYHLAKFSLVLSAKGCLPPWAWLDLWQEVVCRCFVFCCSRSSCCSRLVIWACCCWFLFSWSWWLCLDCCREVWAFWCFCKVDSSCSFSCEISPFF